MPLECISARQAPMSVFVSPPWSCHAYLRPATVNIPFLQFPYAAGSLPCGRHTRMHSCTHTYMEATSWLRNEAVNNSKMQTLHSQHGIHFTWCIHSGNGPDCKVFPPFVLSKTKHCVCFTCTNACRKAHASYACLNAGILNKMKITVSVPLQIVDGKNPLTELLEIIIFVSWYFLFVWLILLLLPLVTQSCFLCGSLCACASLKICQHWFK